MTDSIKTTDDLTIDGVKIQPGDRVLLRGMYEHELPFWRRIWRRLRRVPPIPSVNGIYTVTFTRSDHEQS